QPVALVLTSKPYDKEKVLKNALPEHTEKNTDKGTIYFGKERKALALLDPSVYVLGDPNSVEAFIERGVPKKDGPLTPVLKAAAGKHALAAGMNPEPVAALIDQVPLPAEAEPLKALVKAKASLLTVDLSDKVQAELRGTFGDADDAKSAEKAAEDLRKLALEFMAKGLEEFEKQGKDWAPIVELMKLGQTGLKEAKLSRKDTVVQASLTVKTDLTVLNAGLIAAVQKIREAATRIQGQNNLKQIALAMHNYHDVNGAFPPAAVYDKDGKPL